MLPIENFNELRVLVLPKGKQLRMSRRDYASTTEQSKSSPTFFSSKTGPVFLCGLVARMSKRRLNSPNGICSGKPEEEKDFESHRNEMSPSYQVVNPHTTSTAASRN